MKFLKIPLLFVWRIWFYILILVTILLMAPFLLILTARDRFYGLFWKMVRIWAKVIIYGMGFRLKVTYDEKTDPHQSYIFCPNHASLMDPFMLIAISKNPIVFIGKKELVKIPIFGFFYKRVVVMVQRDDAKSRKKVYERVKKKLRNGISLGIFPEGLVPTENVVLAPFKNGAFSLGIEYDLPIVPQTYFDGKRLFSWDFWKGGPGILRIHQHQFIQTDHFNPNDISKLKQQTFDVIYNSLLADSKYMKDTNRPNNEREFKSPLS